MKGFGVRSLAKSKYAVYSISLLVIQQLFVAVSVYLSIRISTKIVDESATINDLYILIGTSILPFIPGIISNYAKRLWILDTTKTFWMKSDETIGKSLSDDASSVYVSQGKETINRLIEFSFGSISVTLNFIVSALMIGIFLDKYLLIAFFISFLLTFAVYVVFRKRISVQAEMEVKSSAGVVASLEKSLTTYKTRSCLNIEAWKEEKNGSVNKYSIAYIRHERTRTLLIATTTLFSFLPVVVAILWQISSNQDSFYIIALLINLPRIFQIINASTDLVQVVLNAYSAIGYIKIFGVFNNNIDIDSEKYVNISKIRLDNQTFVTVEDAVEWIKRKKTGIVSLKGDNGSGKTSFVMHTMENTGGVYFSPRTRVCWPFDVESGWSDGEYSSHAIEWLLKNSRDTLFLDEWDAFLDQKKVEKIQKALKEYSKDNLIISVNHHLASNL